MRRGSARILLLFALLPLGCRRPRADDAPAASEAGSVDTPARAAAAVSHADIAIDPLSDPGACTFGSAGTVLDLGDPSLKARFGSRLTPEPVEVIEREGATWARLRARSLAVDFFVAADDASSEAPPQAPFLEARMRGGAAKSAAFYLDGKLVGSAPLVHGEARVVSVRGPAAEAAPGAHELTLRLNGAPKATTDELAELDWVHLGRGDPDPKYAAPLRGDTTVSATLRGAATRALTVRAGGYVRCAGWIPTGGRLDATLGLVGTGGADAEVRLLRDRAPPSVLGAVHLSSAEAEGKAFSFPVGDVGDPAGTLGAVELRVVRSTPGTRVLFGDPKLETDRPAAVARPAPARSVVVVVLSEIATRGLALYGGPYATPELSRLAQRGVVFDAHRATTCFEGGAFASMMTGLGPREHSVNDPDARLPATLTTIADAARQAGITAALFTAVPSTGLAFGFDRGWSTFDSQSPTDPGAAVAVLDRAAEWVAARGEERFLLVVHARGGHPPWDVSSEELKTLDPPSYTGGLDARHAAELLERASASPGSLRFGDADRARAWAMYAAAVAAHDAALGRLLAALDRGGRRDDTAVIVTSDVGVDGAARIPFASAGSLSEDSLWVPLVVAAPGGERAGGRVTTSTSGVDVARTVLSALGLAAPAGFGGIDLVDLAGGRASAMARPLVASAGDRFSLRWGRFTDAGQRDRETRLCDLSLEPACISDVRGSYPLAASLLHGAAFAALVGGRPPPPREAVAIDPATASALRAWGR